MKKAPPKSAADLAREKEIEEEVREKKEADKKARKKEAAYQERLRAWETRERRKAKDHDKVLFTLSKHQINISKQRFLI